MVITGDMEMSDIMDPACWETRLGSGLQGAYWEARLLWGTGITWNAEPAPMEGSGGEAATDPPVSYDLSIASV